MTSNSIAQLNTTSRTWLMPIRLEQYPDCNPLLTENEKALMNEYIQAPRKVMTAGRAQKFLGQLARFNTLYLDVVNLSRQDKGAVSAGRRHLFQHMVQTEKACWAWPHDTWIEVIQTAPNTTSAVGTRSWLVHLAYLVCDFLYVGASTPYGLMADAIFGRTIVDAEVDKLHAQLLTLGYSDTETERGKIRWICALAMLVHRSPYIATLSPHDLLTVEELLAIVPGQVKRGRQYLLKLQTALCHLNILDKPVIPDLSKSLTYSPTLWKHDTTVAPAWLDWICAFFEQTPRQHDQTIRSVCYKLFTAGRWLKKNHPDITEPAQWTEELANEYVSYTCDTHRGDQMLPSNMRFPDFQNAPQKLSPRGINARLAGMRFFFSHLQRRTYIVAGKLYPKLQITWLPAEAFKTPTDIIKAAVQPNPRDIQEDTWFKLIWAACTLTKEKMLEAHIIQHPLAYYRAACLVWVTAARRSDEIRRLNVGCVSREWVPEMNDEQGNQIEPEAELCYLRVPTNKISVKRDCL